MMNRIKYISFWLIALFLATITIFSSCKEDAKDEPIINIDPIVNTDTIPDNTHINPDSITGTLTDIDGNVYSILKIDNQWWMLENLKVTRYNDGALIPNVVNDTTWMVANTGAYSNYNNDTINVSKYGRLYNWYAVNTGKLAPKGWHVPTDTEWTALEDYLIAAGFNYDGTTTGNKIAKALASQSDWTPSISVGAIGNNLTLNNTSSFSAFPSGYRGNSGSFNYKNNIAIWWTSTSIDSGNASCRYLFYYIIYLLSGSEDKVDGFSVRCVMG